MIWGPGAPQYIAAGALAGGLPDVDVLFFPLARRFPLLEHRGITHSLVSVTGVAIVGSFLVPYLPYFTHASTFLYFVALEIGGLSHIALDGFTNFAVAPLLPFSAREVRLDADVAINVVMLGLTGATMATLIAEHGVVPTSLWLETTWVLVLVYGGYLVLRSVARWQAGVIRRREGYSAVLPTTNPWVWTLAERRDGPDRYAVRYRRFTFGERRPHRERRMEVAKLVPASGPVGSPQEALDRTYVAALRENDWMASRCHFGESVANGNVYEVAWYIVELGGFGRTVGVRGEIDRSTGQMRLRSGFFPLPVGARDYLRTA